MSKVLTKGGSAGRNAGLVWFHAGTAILFFAVLGALQTVLVPRLAKADSIVTSREVAQLVRLEDVDELDGEIFGYVANHSDQYIYRVTLLIRYHWHWHNELHPGEDDPGRHEQLVLNQMIPPEGRVRFSYRPTTPLPERTDGDLRPTVSIASVQAYEKRKTPAPAATVKPAPNAEAVPAQELPRASELAPPPASTPASESSVPEASATQPAVPVEEIPAKP